MGGSFTPIVVIAFLSSVFCFTSAKEIQGNNVLNELREPVSTNHSFELNSRSIMEFSLMIICGTGKSPLSYNGYGCHCGIGGKGKPVDDTDRCCQVHDACYKAVANSGDCPYAWTIYVMPYARDGCTGCKPESYYWYSGKCRNALCHCDSVAVECFKKSQFNDEYKNYPQSEC